MVSEADCGANPSYNCGVLSRDVGLDTLLLLMRKARLRIKKYETLRVEGDNGQADAMIPQMFALRTDIVTAISGSKRAEAVVDRPNARVMEEAHAVLRSLAPGQKVRRAPEPTEATVVRRSRYAYDDATAVGTPMLHSAKQPSAKKNATRTRAEGTRRKRT